MISLPLTNHREAGVGRDTEQEKRLGDRTKWFQEALLDKEPESPWDKVQLKKGSVARVMPQVSETLTGMDIEKKWEDLEKIPVGEARSVSLIGSEAPQETDEALQTEVLKHVVSDKVMDLFPYYKHFIMKFVIIYIVVHFFYQCKV